MAQAYQGYTTAIQPPRLNDWQKYALGGLAGAAAGGLIGSMAQVMQRAAQGRQAPTYTGPTYQPGVYTGGMNVYGRWLQDALYSGIQQAGRLNPYLQQAGQQISQGAQQPTLWGQAQQAISQRLSPGYSAYGSDLQQAQFEAMRQRIQQAAQEQRQGTLEQLNRAGLLRSGLMQQALQDINEQELQALQQAATQVALQGAEATRADQLAAIQAAMGLGGQQAAQAQQALQNLLGFGQYVQSQQLLPWQMGMEFYRGILQPEAAQDFQQWLAQQQLAQSAAGQAFQQWLAQQQLWEMMRQNDIALEQARAQQQAQQQSFWGDLLGGLVSLAPLLLL